jgi:phosphoribosylanthranilate isomerase
MSRGASAHPGISGESVSPFMLDLSNSDSFVKICGITCREDAEICLDAGADAIGINLFPGSKRYHPLELAKLWLGGYSGRGHPARVALFVNAGLEEIKSVAGTGWFEAIQLHGDESPEFCASVKALGLTLIRALALRSPDDASQIAENPADVFILDAAVPGSYGGSGQVGDWQLAAEAVRRFPQRPMLLGGGLTPQNVAAAMIQVQPRGVDVASGVESAPGVKDAAKVRAFIAAAKGGKG